MEIIYQDEHLIAVNKPSGFHVHPHEDKRHRVPKNQICLYVVRNMINKLVYPVHRLDAGTSGVLVFALSSESASRICKQFAERTPQKTYHAVVRGYVKPEDTINLPLELDSSGELVEASTSYKRLAIKEFPFPVGKKFPTARYSLIEAKPHTGRYHQIRRHFNRISHPLLGDAVHGDSHHNRFFRTELSIQGLCLKALNIEFDHPYTGQRLSLTAPDCDKWKTLHQLFEY